MYQYILAYNFTCIYIIILCLGSLWNVQYSSSFFERPPSPKVVSQTMWSLSRGSITWKIYFLKSGGLSLEGPLYIISNSNMTQARRPNPLQTETDCTIQDHRDSWMCPHWLCTWQRLVNVPTSSEHCLHQCGAHLGVLEVHLVIHTIYFVGATLV